jgi:hypothetical protein
MISYSFLQQQNIVLRLAPGGFHITDDSSDLYSDCVSRNSGNGDASSKGNLTILSVKRLSHTDNTGCQLENFCIMIGDV